MDTLTSFALGCRGKFLRGEPGRDWWLDALFVRFSLSSALYRSEIPSVSVSKGFESIGRPYGGASLENSGQTER